MHRVETAPSAGGCFQPVAGSEGKGEVMVCQKALQQRWGHGHGHCSETPERARLKIELQRGRVPIAVAAAHAAGAVS